MPPPDPELRIEMSQDLHGKDTALAGSRRQCRFHGDAVEQMVAHEQTIEQCVTQKLPMMCDQGVMKARRPILPQSPQDGGGHLSDKSPPRQSAIAPVLEMNVDRNSQEQLEYRL